MLLLPRLGEGQEGRHTQRNALDKCWCFLRCHLRTVSRFARSLHLGSSVCERCGEAGAHIGNRRLHGLCWFSGRESCCCCRVWEKDRKGDIRKGMRWTSVGVSCDVISAPFYTLQEACIWGVPYVSAADRRGRISGVAVCMICAGFPAESRAVVAASGRRTGMEADAKDCAGQVLVFPAMSSPHRFTPCKKPASGEFRM